MRAQSSSTESPLIAEGGAKAAATVQTAAALSVSTIGDFGYPGIASPECFGSLRGTL